MYVHSLPFLFPCYQIPAALHLRNVTPGTITFCETQDSNFHSVRNNSRHGKDMCQNCFNFKNREQIKFIFISSSIPVAFFTLIAWCSVGDASSFSPFLSVFSLLLVTVPSLSSLILLSLLSCLGPRLLLYGQVLSATGS